MSDRKRGDNMWYHPKYGARSWGDLKAMFATVGGINKRRLAMLGWRRSVEESSNPVNVVLG